MFTLFAVAVVWAAASLAVLAWIFRSDWGSRWYDALSVEGDLWARVFGMFLLPGAVFGWMWARVDYAVDNAFVSLYRAIVRHTLFGPDAE